jgi:hypothetical protein
MLMINKNQKCKKKLLFHLGHSAGFYSELNNMIFAILFCVQYNVKFILYSQDANFREDKGWTDYFLPFCQEFFFRPIHYINGRSCNPNLGIKSKVYGFLFRLFFPNILLTQDVWDKFRVIDRNFNGINMGKLNIIDFKKACKYIIESIYVFNSKTRSEIDNLKSSLNLNNAYIAIHIRGGDKITEYNLFDIEKYMEKASRITNINQIFVATDDYTFFEALCDKYKNYNFITLTEPTSRGYMQRDFVFSDGDTRRKQMINMFASMELLLEAQHTICTFSSNIGMFIGLMKDKNVYPVDFKEWRIW